MYVALLRAVNVGGNSISMSDVRDTFASLGCSDVRTYLQSGNIVFSAARTASGVRTRSLEKKFEQGLLRDFGRDITVLVRSANELAAVAGGNPFQDRTDDPTKLHVTFLAERPSVNKKDEFSTGKIDEDEFRLEGSEVYLFCPNGYGRSKLVNSFFEKKLGVQSTTRNWKSVKKLTEMLTT